MRVLFILLFFCNSVHATNYYFSNTGSDAANGTTTSTPWQTLTKLNSFMSSLVAGDSVRFKRGQTFYGKIVFPDGKAGSVGNDIFFGAYDTGSDPIITGLTTLTSWSSLGSGKYESACASCTTKDNVLVIDDTVRVLGRYPNSGFLNYETFSTNTSITDNQLTGSPSWTGAEVVIKKDRFIVETGLITNHSTTTLTYSGGTYNSLAGWGYFFQNSSQTLDSSGEWYFDGSNIEIYSGGVNPTTRIVKTGTIDTLVYMPGNSYIKFDNITFEGGNRYTIHTYYSNNIKLIDCAINYAGDDGIHCFWSDNITITGTTINNAAQNGVNSIGVSSGMIITGNVIKNTSKNLGMNRRPGADPFETSSAIHLTETSDVLIQYNIIDSTGYNGVHFKTGSNVLVNKNFINHSNLNRDDGAGIYCYSGDSGANPTNREISYNIVLNGIGTLEGLPIGNNATLAAQGIYIDGYSKNVVITNNTLAGCSDNGFTMNTFQNTIYRNNTCYNNLSDFNIGKFNTVSGNLNIKSNIFFATVSQLHMEFYYSAGGDLTGFGELDSNYYARPNDINAFYSEMTGSPFTVTSYTLSGWQTVSGKDANSRKIIYTNPATIIFEWNETNSDRVVPLTGRYIDVRGTLYSTSVTIPAYSSVVLMPFLPKILTNASGKILTSSNKILFKPGQ